MNEKTLRTLEFYKIIDMLENKAESSLGKELIRQMKPSTSLEEVEKRQVETEEALELIIKRGNPPLYGIYNIKPELKRLDIGGYLGPGSLMKVSDSLRVSRSLKNYVASSKEDKNSTYKLIDDLVEGLSVFKHIEDEINNAIIGEDEISDNASSALRSIRKQKISKNEAIRSKLNGLINSTSHKKYLQDSIVTMREGRFVVPVKQENRANIPGLVHDMSSSGATVFVEPMAVVELNNELRELDIKEREEIERILKELSLMVGEESDAIIINQDILIELDFIFAKGKLALDQNATRPILNNKGYINIKNGRHPLLEVKKVVPSNIYIGKDFSTLVITGPNTGGKTVTLKTVGLFSLMAQAGLHIPADFNSEIGVFSQIFADIGDEQSIEQSLSTFSSHMTNIVDILNIVDDNSLILFDELGAGTDPTEGAALAMSILDKLLGMDVRTIATTHYSQLKVYALTTEGVRNASVEFDVESLSPTYKLLIGVPGKSNAFEISKRLGLQDYVIDYARDLISRENVQFEDVLQALEKDRIIAEENRLKSESQKEEIARLREEVALERERLKDSRDKIINKAREEARDLLREAKESADYLVGEIRNVSFEIEKDRNKQIQEAQDALKDTLGKVERDISKDVLNVQSNKPPQNLKAGETVKILSFDQIGTVVTEPDNKGDLTVQVGIMKLTVNVKTLKRAKSEENQVMETRTKKMVSNKSKSVSPELDLRGKNLDEAILEVDKYLDDAYIAGLKQIFIIHGKGTGILRAGIKSYLRTHKHVKSSRIGEFGEGGDGVTVVELR